MKSFPNKNKAETLGNHRHVSCEGSVIDSSKTSSQSSREMLDVSVYSLHLGAQHVVFQEEACILDRYPTVHLYECRIVFRDVDRVPWQNLACLLGNAPPPPGSVATALVYCLALIEPQ